MAFLEYADIGILGMAGAIPKRIVNNYEYVDYFSAEEVKKVVDKIGIKERRFADKDTCASDLCFAAATKLFSDLDIDKSEIDLLVFVSQTADYKMPASSIILQDRLGLSKSTIAFDLSIGCSGFVYGLSVIYSFMQNAGVRKALLLDGETRSRVYSPKDRKTAFLFGDAGIAAIIEKDPKYRKSFFSLNSNGALQHLIKIDAGGSRNPSSIETLKEQVIDEYGNIRNAEHGYMNGSEVFNFVIREIPKDFKNILKISERNKEEIDYYIFHQANDFMNNYLMKKLKLPEDKVPSTIHKFGNTSSVSIPITIVSELKNELKDKKTIFLSGFGVGMSWASSILNVDNCKISEIIEI
jgi:3-oxoacyl-[acyl-carrier-protein] synthase-3